uniref:Putative head-tail connector n=2 Tax=viral metagenome TaxID=1070528 RepID=A0A6M3IPP2_9ZZZZ
MHSYCSISEVKNVLGITSTTDDVMLRKICESSSQSVDQYTNRHFYTQPATKYFDGAVILWVPDLLSITTLKTDEDGDGTYENTFDTTFATGDVIPYGVGLEDTLNTFPKVRLEINPDGDYSSFASGVKKGVELAGIWGYGDGISATPYVSDTTITEDLTAGESAIDVTAVTNLSAGQLILIGSEQYYIYSISSLTLTVEAGVNGTTEATHSSGATIYIYQYPSDIRQACIDLSVATYQNRAKQGLQTERIGDYSYTIAGTSLGKSMVESILESIGSYKRMRF